MSDSFDDILSNKIKQIDTRTLERIIAKAIGDLLGEEYSCNISKIEYPALSGAKFDVSLSTPLKFDAGPAGPR